MKRIIPLLSLGLVSFGVAAVSLACGRDYNVEHEVYGVDAPCDPAGGCAAFLTCHQGICRPECTDAEGAECNGITRQGTCVSGICMPAESLPNGSASVFGFGPTTTSAPSVTAGAVTRLVSSASASPTSSATATLCDYLGSPYSSSSLSSVEAPPVKPTDCTVAQVKATAEACFGASATPNGCTAALDTTGGCSNCLVQNGARLGASIAQPGQYDPQTSMTPTIRTIQYGACVATAMGRPDCQLSLAGQQLCADTTCSKCTGSDANACKVRSVQGCHNVQLSYSPSGSGQTSDGCPNFVFIDDAIVAKCRGADAQATFELVATQLCTSGQ